VLFDEHAIRNFMTRKGMSFCVPFVGSDEMEHVLNIGSLKNFMTWKGMSFCVPFTVVATVVIKLDFGVNSVKRLGFKFYGSTRINRLSYYINSWCFIFENNFKTIDFFLTI